MENLEVSVHRWPVITSGPRGKNLQRTGSVLETRKISAALDKTSISVNFGMGDWVAFRLSDGQAKRLGMRDWCVDSSDVATLKKKAAEQKKLDKIEKAKKR